MLTRIFKLIILLFSITHSVTSSASVIITGSRIIYPSDARSIDVQLKNTDNIPYVIQAWFDNGDVNSKPDQNSDTPFIITPPVFRVQPLAGQIVRVIYTPKEKLPADRESVFWFNALEIPPRNVSATAHQNTMMVMLRNRLKIFYRPESIGTPGNILHGLKVHSVTSSTQGYGLVIDNPQPWYVSLVSISINYDGKKIPIPSEMIPPYTKKTFWASSIKKGDEVQGVAALAAINDQGARVSETYQINTKKY